MRPHRVVPLHMRPALTLPGPSGKCRRHSRAVRSMPRRTVSLFGRGGRAIADGKRSAAVLSLADSVDRVGLLPPLSAAARDRYVCAACLDRFLVHTAWWGVLGEANRAQTYTPDSPRGDTVSTEASSARRGEWLPNRMTAVAEGVEGCTVAAPNGGICSRRCYSVCVLSITQVMANGSELRRKKDDGRWPEHRLASSHDRIQSGRSWLLRHPISRWPRCFSKHARPL